MTPEEVRLLVQRAQMGEKDAQDTLIRSYRPLVMRRLMRYSTTRLKRNREDAEQEGTMGLLRAIEKYDLSQKLSFGSYAKMWIDAFLLQFIEREIFQMKASRHVRSIVFRIAKAQRELARRGEPDTNEALAMELGSTVTDVAFARASMVGVMQSLDDAPGTMRYDQHSRGRRLHELLWDDEISTPEEAVSAKQAFVQATSIAQSFAATLVPRDAQVFYERIVASEPETLEALGKKLGLTRERVRQLEARILDRFRTFVLRP